MKLEASNDDWQDLLVAYSVFFNETLRTYVNTGGVFVSRTPSSTVSELSFGTTASALPIDEVNIRTEELQHIPATLPALPYLISLALC